MKIKISKGGRLTFIYDDKLQPLIQNGRAEIKRVSHVEPIGTKWRADMSPIEPGIVLGPFNKRQQALDAEKEWLEEKLLT